MNIRHLATKGFDSNIEITKSVVFTGAPITITSSSVAKTAHLETVEFSKQLPESVSITPSLMAGRVDMQESPIGTIVMYKDDVLPLSRLFDYKVSEGDFVSQVLPLGTPFSAIFKGDVVQDFLIDNARTMFPHINPNTGVADIDVDAYYTPYISLVTLTGCITPQKVGDNVYFNPNGVVSIAEFLDGLNAINYGCNANNCRKKTLDNISDDKDYFNEGYQKCLRGISSPFFNLYTRYELTQPLTRLELAYITVICWTQFIEKYNNLFGSAYYLGVNFDWESPADILQMFEDGFDYKVSKVTIDKDYDVVSLNIKDYASDRSMSEYKEDLQTGVSPIPLPALMSMLELHVLDIFRFEDGRLDPMKEVSRGELCYFLVKLAQTFTTKYFNN